MHKYQITNDEFNALKYLYYSALIGVDTQKGINFMHCFKLKKFINELVLKIKKENINVDDLIEVNNYVNKRL